MTSDDSPDLHRYWIEFTIPQSEMPAPTPPGTITLDGGSHRYRALVQGVGVTGYDLADALELLRDAFGFELPKVRHVTEDPDLSGPEWDHYLTRSGSPIWRSIWFPLAHDQPR